VPAWGVQGRNQRLQTDVAGHVVVYLVQVVVEVGLVPPVLLSAHPALPAPGVGAGAGGTRLPRFGGAGGGGGPKGGRGVFP